MREPSRLTKLRYSHVKNEQSYFWYRCECGTEKVIQKSSVLRGLTRSCGCLRREKAAIHINNLPEGVRGRGAGRKPGFKGFNTNKGKVRIIVNGRRKYITQEELAEMYYSGGQ